MKKGNHSKTISFSKAAALGAIITFQAMPDSAFAQNTKAKVDTLKQSTILRKTDYFLKFANTKLASQKLTVIAFLNGEPVLKTAKSEMYQLNTETGDLRIVSKEEYSNLSFPEKVERVKKIYPALEKKPNPAGSKASYKVGADDYYMKNQITLLGVDKDGHEIFENSKKEKFFFDPATGDMVDYNGHIIMIQ